MGNKEKIFAKNKVLNVAYRVVVTGEDIDDIMATALEGGITHWCDEASVNEKKRVADWGHEQIARNGELLIHVIEPFDQDDTEWYTLTEEKFLRGLEKYLKNPIHGEFLEFADGELKLDTCYVDASVADAIVQYALFDEIIYG